MIHRLEDPASLLNELACLSCHAHAVIITIPVWLFSDSAAWAGHSPERDQVADWHLRDFERLLGSHGLVPSFIGLMASNPACRTKDALIAVLDNCEQREGWSCTDRFRPLAIMGSYNDARYRPPDRRNLLADGFDVHVLDNWSTDGTHEHLTCIAAARNGLVVERFPQEGPTQYHEWDAMLRRKEEIAQRFAGRWIIHTDSDEVRSCPWSGISLRGGLHIVERMGFTAVDSPFATFDR